MREATEGRQAGDQPATRVRCPTCHQFFNRTALARHRRRRHPEITIEALETPNHEIRLRNRKTYSALRCAECHQVIPVGTETSTLVYDTSSRRPRWAHLRCPPNSPEGASPPSPQKEEEETPPGLELVAFTLPPTPSPTPATPPEPATGRGDSPLISPERAIDLGIVGARSAGRHIILELKEENAAQVLSAILGQELTECLTCKDLGRGRVVMPRSHLTRHDFEEHADLWRRGRLLAEIAAIRERQNRRGQDPPTLPSGRSEEGGP